MESRSDVMSIRDELDRCIIDKCERDDNWYYHGFELNSGIGIRDFQNMLNQGIECQFLRGVKESGRRNGLFYVSLSKIVGCSQHNSSYLCITSKLPAFIIDGIKPIKTKVGGISMFDYSILPFRTSPYEDEYHAFLKVKPDNFMGLQLSLQEIADCIDAKYKYICVLADILDYLVSIESSLPFYGFDDPVGELYLIDKEKCRNLIKPYRV